MIVFNDVTKVYKTHTAPKVILSNVTMVMPTDRNIGILGRNGVGKSTVMRLIAKADKPTSGRIETTGRISWPMGFGGGFQNSLSVIDNVRFIARIYGVDWRKAVDFVENFGSFGSYLHMPVMTLSSGMRARLNLAMSLAIRFDVYLMDEIPGVGDTRFKARFSEAFEELRGRASLVLISHNPAMVRKYCDTVFLMTEGTLTRFDDVEEGLQVHAAT